MEKPNRITTTGQLRAALEGVPDDTPLIVNAADLTDLEFVDGQVITSTGFGLVDWGDRHGLQQDNVFALNCHLAGPEDDMRRRSARPERDEGRTALCAQAERDLLATAPEAEL